MRPEGKTDPSFSGLFRPHRFQFQSEIEFSEEDLALLSSLDAERTQEVIEEGLPPFEEREAEIQVIEEEPQAVSTSPGRAQITEPETAESKQETAGNLNFEQLVGFGCSSRKSDGGSLGFQLAMLARAWNTKSSNRLSRPSKIMLQGVTCFK